MTDEPTEKTQPEGAQQRSEAARESGQENSASSRIHGEVQDGIAELVSVDRLHLNKQKEDRNLSLGEQIQKNGTATIGTISKQFKCSVEITDGDNVVVKGRSRQEIVEALKYMEQESSKGMLLAPGGQFVSRESGKPQRELLADSSSAPLSVEVSYKNFPGEERLIASKPGEAKPGVVAHPNIERFLKSHPDLALSESEKARLTPQLEALRKKVNIDVARFHELDRLLPKQRERFHEHLQQATQTKENSPGDQVQAAFDKLPREQKDALLAERSPQSTAQTSNPKSRRFKACNNYTIGSNNRKKHMPGLS